ncbi:phosphotransferase enzyme family protein [Conexibacter woesei]|uniref:phosphotransferase enzyme family protein n=1 Tax=Conexibacter woesei TaxID=191495 RepID=UPI0009D68AD5|nr:aminoglycoside phosphotransferase family protein [Conexibacter woesei]
MRAAVAVATAHGVRVHDAVVLRDVSNVLIHLRPAPVVARVATATLAMRGGAAWRARELAVASHLARAGAPVVAPSAELPPGPHGFDGLSIGFWEHVVEVDAPLDGEEAGRRLRRCHELLCSFEGELPRMAALSEARAIVERLAADAVLSPDDAGVLRRAGARVTARVDRLVLPLQPVHGDAHLGNVLNTARGPLWNDWEDTFLGPRAWDLGCLHASAPPFGHRDPALIAATQRGYGIGDPDLRVLDAYVAARRFQATVWGVEIARTHPDRRAWAERQLARLRRAS